MEGEVGGVTRTPPLFGLERPLPTKDDYYTPRWVFDGLELRFDLDVAAPPGGVPWIPAREFYTQADDGLSQPWRGMVWCNPPFSGCAHWVRRFIEHGDGVLLASIPGNRSWLPDLVRGGALIWFHDVGVDFHNPTLGKQVAIPWPTMFAALGPDAQAGLRRLAATRPGVLVIQEP
jgi:hypothetical protein